MTGEAINKTMKMKELLRRQLEPIQASVMALETNTGLRTLIEEADRHHELMRAALGPLEELRRVGLLCNMGTELTAGARQARELIAQVQSNFRLPESAEAANLLLEFEGNGLAKSLERHRELSSEIQRAMEMMRAPWLDIQDRLSSVTGFAELQGIGHALRNSPPFDKHLADSLRFALGDWRAKIDWPSNIFTDPVARTAFYAGRGLDPALTAFPAAAFNQSLDIAGLTRGPPPLVDNYGPDSQDEGDDDEAAFERTNAAHDRLMRFETQIRSFIDERLKAAFGDNWVKHRVPGEIRKTWVDKQQKAKDNGEPQRPLIAYADFADYVPIISRADNWEAVFKPIFRRQTLVQESFQRLYPIRICTMHARLITQDDELYLYVETKRILSAIEVDI